ncbi:MAG: hypothetical protein ACRD0N_08000 [Acidimicrobiales bacterium]
MVDLARHGVAVVPGALSQERCDELVDEAARANSSYLDLPPRVNGVHQRAEQLAVRTDDPELPALGRLISVLRATMALQPRWTGLRQFVPTQARFMRYRGNHAGLGLHRDGKCYALVVCVFSLAGTAPFRVVGEDGGPSLDVLVHAGDLVLLRAPGFAGVADGRLQHAVGAPMGEHRISLTIRMVRAHPRAAPAPPWSATSHR